MCWLGGDCGVVDCGVADCGVVDCGVVSCGVVSCGGVDCEVVDCGVEADCCCLLDRLQVLSSERGTPAGGVTLEGEG